MNEKKIAVYYCPCGVQIIILTIVCTQRAELNELQTIMITIMLKILHNRIMICVALL